MIASLLLLAPLLAAQGMASHNHLAHTNLIKRQGDAFIPGTTPGCPQDWPVCGTSGVCYNPRIGDTCCPGGTYACPAGSFCLTAGYCCPDGLDPEICAKDYGVTLPSTTTTISASTSSITSEPSEIPPPIFPSSSGSSITISSTPIITPTSSLIPPAYSSYVPSSSTPVPPVFTGAASNAREMAGAAAILGGLGLLRNLI